MGGSCANAAGPGGSPSTGFLCLRGCNYLLTGEDAGVTRSGDREGPQHHLSAATGYLQDLPVIGCNSSLEGYGEAVISVTFIPRTLAGSNKWVRGLSREPLRTYIVAHYVASSSKDVSVCIWDTTSGCYEHIFMGHTHSVTCL